MPERLTLNITEAAKAIGCSRKYFYDHLLTQSTFPVIRLGRKILIPVDSLRTWLANQSEVGKYEH